MTSITDHNSLLGPTCMQKRCRSSKHTSAMYLALLLLCAGDIETNPGPIACFVMLLLLYITLDGCGLSSLSSSAAPVMIFSRQLNGNDSGTDNRDGLGGGEDGASQIGGTVVGSIGTISTLIAIIGCILAIKKYFHDKGANIRVEINRQDDSNEEMIDVGGSAELKCRVFNANNDYIDPKLQRSYKWARENEEVGANEENFVIDPFKPDEAGSYSCIVTFKRSWRNWAYLQKENTYQLQCKDGEAEITCELPDSSIYTVGDKVTLACTVNNVSDGIIDELKYQWLREESDGTEHKLITGKIMKLSPLTMKDAGRYHCVVTCDKLGEWEIKSNTKFVKVEDGEAEITCDLPDSSIYIVGDEVTLTCTVKNVSDRITNELKYQWLREESDGTEHELITGKIMTLSLLIMKDAGRYRCVVTCDKLGEWSIKSNTKVVKVEDKVLPLTSQQKEALPNFGISQLTYGETSYQDLTESKSIATSDAAVVVTTYKDVLADLVLTSDPTLGPQPGMAATTPVKDQGQTLSVVKRSRRRRGGRPASNTEIRSRHLGKIADAMVEWEGAIADMLKLTPSDVAAIKTKYPQRFKLQSREALHYWKQRNGTKATYRKLTSVFQQAGYQSYADEVGRINQLSDSETDDSSGSGEEQSQPEQLTYYPLTKNLEALLQVPPVIPKATETYMIITDESLPEVVVETYDSRPKRHGKPKEHELHRIDYNGETIRIISSTAGRWKTIATRFYFDGNMIDIVERDTHFRVEESCRRVFNMWLGGREGLREPKTWATVVDVLKEANLGTLSGDLNSVLS